MKKRLLSTILALCMIMTIIPIMPIVSSAAQARSPRASSSPAAPSSSPVLTKRVRRSAVVIKIGRAFA